MLGLAAGLGAVNLDTATAAGDLPLDGELCTARENIYVTDGQDVIYTARAGQYIRIVYGAEAGDNHAYGYTSEGGKRSGFFVWRHSDGTSRLRNCH